MAETYEIIAGKPTIKKRTNEVLDYGLNWADFLGLEGDVIAASVWTLSLGLTQASAAYTETATSVSLSGGLALATETATNKITTSTGRVAERTLYLQIWNF